MCSTAFLPSAVTLYFLRACFVQPSLRVCISGRASGTKSLESPSDVANAVPQVLQLAVDFLGLYVRGVLFKLIPIRGDKCPVRLGSWSRRVVQFCKGPVFVEVCRLNLAVVRSPLGGWLARSPESGCGPLHHSCALVIGKVLQRGLDVSHRLKFSAQVCGRHGSILDRSCCTVKCYCIQHALGLTMLAWSPRTSSRTWFTRPGLGRKEQVLICLAVGHDKPRALSEIRDLATVAGLKGARDWNLSAILASLPGKAVRTSAGWELTADGKADVGGLVGVRSPAHVSALAVLRGHISRLNPPTSAPSSKKQ